MEGIVMKMTKEQKQMLNDFKVFRACTGKYTANCSGVEEGAFKKATAGIKRMNVKRLCV